MHPPDPNYPPAAVAAGYCHSVGGHVAAVVSPAAAGAPPMLPRVEFRLEFRVEFRLREGASAPEEIAARWAARSSPPQCTRVVPPTAMAVLVPTTDPVLLIGEFIHFAYGAKVFGREGKFAGRQE